MLIQSILKELGIVIEQVLSIDLTVVQTVYANSMRSSLFTGFLTLGSFLLASKTFLAIQFRKDIFEGDYLQWHRRLDPSAKPTEPLKLLVDRIGTNIQWSLSTSAAQFSLGFVPHWTAALTCCSLAAITLFITFGSVRKMRRNFSVLFEWIDFRAEQPTAVVSTTPKTSPDKSPRA